MFAHASLLTSSRFIPPPRLSPPPFPPVLRLGWLPPPRSAAWWWQKIMAWLWPYYSKTSAALWESFSKVLTFARSFDKRHVQGCLRNGSRHVALSEWHSQSHDGDVISTAATTMSCWHLRQAAPAEEIVAGAKRLEVAHPSCQTQACIYSSELQTPWGLLQDCSGEERSCLIKQANNSLTPDVKRRHNCSILGCIKY